MGRHKKTRSYRGEIRLEMDLKATLGVRRCPVIQGPEDLVNVFRALIRLEREVLISGALDCKCRLIHWSLLGVGSSHSVIIRVGDAYQGAIQSGAMGIVLVHNHPSGSLESSAEDQRLTRQVKLVGGLLGYPLLDHVIIAKSGFRSLMPRRMDTSAEATNETPLAKAAESGVVASV